MRQTYTSKSSVDSAVRYVFPLPSDTSVCGYKAIIDGTRTIKGVVKSKTQARADYATAVKQGKTATMLEQMNEEVFEILLGNLRPDQTVEVEITFVGLIAQQDTGKLDSLRITLPSAIGPRYGTPPSGSTPSVAVALPSFTRAQHPGLELTVSIQTSAPIRTISSPSHPISTHLGALTANSDAEFNPKQSFVKLDSPEFLTADIVLLIQSADLDRPRCMVESFAPEEGAEEWTDSYALTLVPRFELPPLPKQEFIFLVDRSGSMSGGNMNAVRASLQIMLKSLPTRNTLFNIVSFGDNSSSLWPTSQPYTSASVATASAHVDTMSADYGGTEILSALEKAVDIRNTVGKKAGEGVQKVEAAGETEHIPTSMFVLTDGESWDLENVIRRLREWVQEVKEEGGLLRAFVLGIGDGVSRAMCDGIARSGQGLAIYVDEREKPDHKLMALLRAARGAPVEDITVDWGLSATEDTDEDFEMIESDKINAPPQAPESQAPVSLFDPTTDPAKPSKKEAEVGPKPVTLPPPPQLQVAPAVETLPSLYPGFRTSLFAIAKRASSGQGAPSKEVKIRGTMLGRPVELVVPVTIPIHLTASDSSDSEDGQKRKMLHLLAARALIQSFEDAKGDGTKTLNEVEKAQVLRLALRYGLASSQTSFIAVDENSAPTTGVSQPAPPGGGSYAREASQGLAQPMLGSRMAMAMPPPPVRPSPTRASIGVFQSVSNSPSSPRYSQSSPSRFLDMEAEVDDDGAEDESDSESDSQTLQPDLRKKKKSRMVISDYDDYIDITSDGGDVGGVASEPADGFVQTASPAVVYASPPAPAPSSTATAAFDSFTQRIANPTVDAFARLQTFEGAFENAPWLPQALCKQPILPPLPSIINALTCVDEVKVAVWRTLLCIAYLEDKLPEDRDVWEVMVEKALDWAREELPVGGASVEDVLAGAKTQATLAIAH